MPFSSGEWNTIHHCAEIDAAAPSEVLKRCATPAGPALLAVSPGCGCGV
jgi:hypothetical protein